MRESGNDDETALPVRRALDAEQAGAGHFRDHGATRQQLDDARAGVGRLLEAGAQLVFGDPERVELARKNFKRAGVDKFVTIIQGDAHKMVKKLEGPIDIIFIDADSAAAALGLGQTDGSELLSAEPGQQGW